ncbi:MAG: hypothetical protein ACI4I2_00210 [Oscillospiraceae bacterium]
MVKTVTLTAGTPQTVAFSESYPFFWIDNKTSGDVYASVGTPEPDMDGTYTIAAGSQLRISGAFNNSLTLLGEGKVQIIASAISDCPFKSAAKGGGTAGITPHIDPKTNHWFIGDKDTGVSAVGKSIKSLTSDENENIIVVFTDGTTQNIGKLTVDVQADFLTEVGFGKLRYYNGHFQYHDENSDTWVDTSVTPDNVYVMNMTPQPMQSITCKYDKAKGKLKLKFTEPNDTIVDGQAFCIVEKVVIRRKLGSAPTDENDGDFVTEIPRRDFGAYSNSWFVDEGIIPEIGNTYYYKAFPMSTTGFYSYSDINATSVTCKEAVLYGFKLDQNESDPASMISYLDDCDNAEFSHAYMDYENDAFNYGDWEDAWFIKDLKPCMLKYDGTVDYELDPNDYTKKADGTDSDVANTNYEGNAMIGFPKNYWKIVDNGDDTANVYISDTKLDDDFHCWSHIDNDSSEIDYCYMPIYTGSLVDGRLRSLSGLAPIANKTRQQEINYAKANNLNDDIIWYTEVYSDRMLLELLVLLIGKSTDTQTIFGTGNNDSYTSTSNVGVKNSGTMDAKGLFWGSQDNVSGVKVFGMEHVWGNIWRAVAGWINDNGVQKVKMTYGQNDGSTVDGYNLDGSGYIAIPNSAVSGTSGGYISKMLFSENGLIPITVSGSASTYYNDGLWFKNTQINYAQICGSSSSKTSAGIFCSALSGDTLYVYATVGISLSCKPLAPTT